MLRPTYNDLIGALNEGEDDSAKEVESRYSVVIASAKRARQIIDGEPPLVPGEAGRKPLSIAVDEISKHAVTIQKGSEVDDEPVSLSMEREDFLQYALDDEEETYEEEEEKEEEDGDGREDEYEAESDSEAE